MIRDLERKKGRKKRKLGRKVELYRQNEAIESRVLLGSLLRYTNIRFISLFYYSNPKHVLTKRDCGF